MRVNERKQKQRAFLNAYRNGVSVRQACEITGVARATVYKWSNTDPVFKQQFDEAGEDVNDRIDDEIMRRGVDGWDEPVASSGKQVYTKDGEPLMIRRYSDKLLEMLAKSRMHKYREKQQVEHSGTIDVNSARETLLQKLQSMSPREGAPE